MVADETSQHILKMVNLKEKLIFHRKIFPRWPALLLLLLFLQIDRSLIKALIATAGNGIEIDHQTDNHL